MSRDDESMAICAIRYTIGRRSYVVSEGQQWALVWGEKSDWVRRIIIRDLREASQRGDGALGDAHDAVGWRSVLSRLTEIETATDEGKKP